MGVLVGDTGRKMDYIWLGGDNAGWRAAAEGARDSPSVMGYVLLPAPSCLSFPGNDVNFSTKNAHTAAGIKEGKPHTRKVLKRSISNLHSACRFPENDPARNAVDALSLIREIRTNFRDVRSTFSTPVSTIT